MTTIATCPLCHTAYDQTSWRKLKCIGLQDDDEGGTLELRNCSCTTTLSIRIVPPLVGEQAHELADIRRDEEAIAAMFERDRRDHERAHDYEAESAEIAKYATRNMWRPR